MNKEAQENLKKKSLGRGLSSLFPTSAETPPAAVETIKETIVDNASTQSSANSQGQRIPGIAFVLISQIKPNPFQPRREFDQDALNELADSIKENGIIQPLIVRKSDNNTYQLIAGERRWRASKIAGLEMVPVVIRKSSDKESMELAIIENIQRQDLNCVDEALAYFQLIEEFGISQEEVAKRIGKPRSTVANFLRLLKLPDNILQDIKKDKLSFGHAKVLLQINDVKKLDSAYHKTVENSWAVRELEDYVNSLNNENLNAAVENIESEDSEQKIMIAEEKLIRGVFSRLIDQKGKIKIKSKKNNRISVELVFENIKHLNESLTKLERV